MPRFLLSCLVLLPCLSAPALAGSLGITVEIPRLQVAEYHRPYVAVWIENADAAAVAQLAVWYDLNNTKEDGAQWLKDLRQWWRRGGRNLSLPVDGVTGATRPAGQHRLQFDTKAAPLKKLPAGNYQLVVEAAREVGGRELVRLPFTWPITQEAHQDATGTRELGRIDLDLHP